ncbi:MULTISPECIES: ABC transporter substrate-binding protein [Pelosinus]|uniref:ABC-type transporter, periplasmic subunit n=1 Tax=Pelosinus fermentans B4 TaxID=1149862 RepID=I9ATP5_9FIRM|nr:MULTISPECIES: ABC transporter substrate-binding protein [Pelosinus]EIW16302.1 ABC-type transporter, periplasmic subunit [Pelosinus fermentans B4]EIW22717.1 ABC-type transporter, periplasmic subunit [Pelosinus fermentans A11]OAM95609.1 ABC-type transporter, periplasmic subunit [Pelosinus fermentans DSM 17108]SDR30500.1 iron complex transport system substrate-binding protein [Pelosinus fermentans]
MKYKMLLIFLTVFFIFGIMGCAQKQNGGVPATGSSNYLSIQDDAGRQVILPKKPERIVPLSQSLVDLLYAVGGSAAGRPSSRTGTLPKDMQILPEVGHVANINTEKVMSLQPDLVIGYQGLHEKNIPIMESSNIPFIIVKIKTYDDVIKNINLFGGIAGRREQARIVADQMNQRIKKVVDQLPSTSKSAVILHATGNSVTVQLENSIAGDVAKIIKLKNVAADSIPLDGNPESTPYSIEKLVEKDPDIILITFMGEKADIEKRLKLEVESNPAWNGLRAVQNKQVFYLSMELFLLNPGIRYDEAVAYMAKIVYPETYGIIQ